jgi:hypothetical protein
MNVRSRGGFVALGLGVAAACGVAGLVVAGTSRAMAGPPCAIEVATVAAGSPLELSGSMPSSGGLVEIVARNERGYLREGDVRGAGDRWSGAITFRLTDVGPWSIRIVDGATACESPLTVTLPQGATAPPVEAGFVDDTLVPPPPLIDGSRVVTWLATTTVALVLASWLFLAFVAAGAVAGFRPLAGVLRRNLARGAAFIAVLGAVTGAAVFVDFLVSMSHFDTGTPAEEQAVLNAAIGISVVVGAAAGWMAARRIREPS